MIRLKKSHRKKFGNFRTLKKSLAPALMLAACGGLARADSAPKPGAITVSGLADLYFGINFRAPHTGAPLALQGGGTVGIDNVGRSFDINDRIPSLSLFEVDLHRNEGAGIPFGITATLTAGDTAKIVQANEPGGTSAWQTIQQFYVTKVVNVDKYPITFDFGKWVTLFGQEVIESSSNDEYSRSFGFQYAIPFYHFGLRASVPLSPTVTATGAIVNGWNNVADDNNAKSAHIGFTWTPNTMFTGTLMYMGGSEGTGAYGVPINKGYIKTNLFEFLPTYQVTPALKLAGELDYGQGAGTNGTAHVSGEWIDMAAYLKYQLTPKSDIAARVEQFEDIPGAGGVGLRTGATGYNKLDEFTLDYEYDFFKGNLITRLEYRHDHSNQSFFLAGAGNSPDQDTFYASAVVKF